MRKEIACPNYLEIGHWPFVFNQLQWPCDYSQSRPYGLAKNQKRNCLHLQPTNKALVFALFSYFGLLT